jgi:hypothetical protein
LEEHVINLDIVGEIAAVLAAAQVSDFSPVLYGIPYKRISKQIKVVPVERRAHPTSDEYQIDLLPRAHFDMIELPV